MFQQLKKLVSRRRKAVAGGVVIVTAAILALVAGQNWIGRQGGTDTDVPASPRLNTGTEGGGAAAEVVSVGAVSSGAISSDGRLRIRLSQGQAQPDTADPVPVAVGDPLTAAEIQQILDRLPQLDTESADQTDFRLPEETLPAPRPGETVSEQFPPPPPEIAAPETAVGPLEVVRYSPEGEIPVAPFLNVTFNQPMAPLTALESLAAADVPVELTPAIPGVWKWISPQTVRFEYEGEAGDSFPMATEYRAQIPAGTQSATGGVLAEAVSWTFSTPPPTVTDFYPQSGPQPLEPVLFAAFDQQIDPAAVLETIQLEAEGQRLNLRLATEAEIAADEVVSRWVENGRPGQWIAFRAARPLPTAGNILITIGPGTPSAEGPRTTESAQSYTFTTYAPLDINDHRCGWSDDECPPLAPFYIYFNNPLDVDAYDEAMISVEPAIPNATIDIDHSTIIIRGTTAGRTTYRVRVAGEIQDIFGQTLSRDETLRFRVGSAPKLLVGPEQNLVTLDPSLDAPQLSVYSINFDRLEARAYAVTPADWEAFLTYRDNLYRDPPPSPPGREVLNTTIDVGSEDDVLTETAVDLSQALDGSTGHLVLVIEPPAPLISLDRNPDQYRVVAWVQVTGIGLDAFVDHSEMVAWATDLQTGAPLPGIAVQLGADDGATAASDAAGLARFSLSGASPAYLTARIGDDVAFLPSNPYYFDRNTWQRRSVDDELRWYLFDDRQMYRPGEEVHVKGWLRLVGGKQNGDVGLVGDRVTAVQYTLFDSRGNEFHNGQAEVNALGGFDTAFTLPQNINLGHTEMQVRAVGSTGGLEQTQYYHTFQVQEFRRPEFEVAARNETSGPYFVGDQATVAVTAAYFAGGPLPNADVTWTVTSSPGSYTPPNWSDFTFGVWTPWWFGGYLYEAEFAEPGFPGPGGGEQIVDTFTGVTDAGGEHYLQLDFEELEGVRPFSVMAEATVIDVNRQAWSAATSLLVHPADLYVGLRSPRTFVRQGTPLEIEAIVTDVDGNAITGREVKIEAARLEWRSRRGAWQQEEVDVQTCTVTSAPEPFACTFTTEQGGTYRVTATVTDEQGRSHRSQLTRWVSGGRQPASRRVEQESVTLIPDKETYQPGEVAEILVQAPFSPAEGLLTVSRSGILYSEQFQMTGDTHTLRVPIEDGHIPNLHVQIDLVGETARTDETGDPIEDAPPRPAYATGRMQLSIPPHSRELDLTVTPQDTKLAPGEETAVSVTVTNANGRPVADAELAVVVVDEAILALSDYQLTDPLSVFYTARSSRVTSHYGRASIVLANPQALADQAQNAARVATDTVVEEAEEMAMAAEAPAMEDAAAGEAPGGEPIAVRADFNPLATFAPEVRTDGNGQAEIPLHLPDNLTRYRIMVVAVAGGRQFGAGEANLTARLPLMVRPSAPRFLNFGDRFEFPVVVQNQTDDPLTVDVVLDAGNLELIDPAGRRVDVPANDRVEVRFPATTLSAGTARYQIAAVSGEYADAATGDLPVYTPATTEAFATYGVLDEGAVAQPVAIPDGLYPQFGGLEINTSSTALQALTDAVLYLTSYPYECSEQLASRILAIAALRDVLTAFEAEGLPAPAELETAVQQDIERLQAMQNGDGGFPIWTKGRESVPFYSIHAAHALTRARLKGFTVSDEALSRAIDYLRNIESHYPHWYSQKLRWNLSAYALYVRDVMGDPDAMKARALFDEAGLENLTLEGAAWLWPTLTDDGQTDASEAIQRHLLNRVVETAAAANFTTDYGDDAYLMLHSNRRTDGVILDALIDRDPASDLIPKVVNGLLAHRTKGHWGNTQENVFILLALDRYFNTFEAETPEFVARIWLGDTYAAEHEFVGRTTERRQTEIPMSFLVAEASAETADLILSKEGPGRLYYRLGLSYAPTDLELAPLDMGFSVTRVYEAVDDPEDVTQDADGVWYIRPGARVRVTVNMVTNNRRYHVALADPLPAGLEIVNPALAVSGDMPQNPAEITPRTWWWGPWYAHQNMRDQRAEAFATLLWEGVYEYSYIARATTPGEFVAPPAKAEEMYTPEVFGRSGSDRVVVDER